MPRIKPVDRGGTDAPPSLGDEVREGSMSLAEGDREVMRELVDPRRPSAFPAAARAESLIAVMTFAAGIGANARRRATECSSARSLRTTTGSRGGSTTREQTKRTSLHPNSRAGVTRTAINTGRGHAGGIFATAGGAER